MLKNKGVIDVITPAEINSIKGDNNLKEVSIKKEDISNSQKYLKKFHQLHLKKFQVFKNWNNVSS